MSVVDSISVQDAIETKPLRLSGSQPFTQQPSVFIMIGERTNVAGSPRFATLIKAGKYEEAIRLLDVRAIRDGPIARSVLAMANHRLGRPDHAVPPGYSIALLPCTVAARWTW